MVHVPWQNKLGLCRSLLPLNVILYFICTDYLSINKPQTLKAIALESRSDFVAWMSALRLAKYGGEELSLAYNNCLMPPAAPSLGNIERHNRELLKSKTNKTRVTRVLSRPAISTKYLSQVFQQSIQAMLSNAQQYSKILRNAQICPEMLNNCSLLTS